MPYLGDFLGLLAREVTLARLHADTEAIRVAEFYAADPLLKYFPVPRFRLPNVNVHVAVAVAAMDESASGPAVDLGKVKSIFNDVFAIQLKQAGQDVAGEARQRVDDAVTAAVTALAADPTASLGIRAIAKALADAALTALGQERPWAIRQLDTTRSSLAVALEAAMLPIRVPPARLSVAVTQEQLKEAGDNVLRLDLTLSEDALEWTLLDPDDSGSTRLVPE